MLKLYQNDLFSEIYTRASEPAFAEKIAIQEPGGTAISYRGLVNTVEVVAASLVQHGFEPGDRALLLARPSIDLVIIVLAVVRAGGTLVMADPAMGQAVFEERVRLAAPRWVFADSLFLVLQKVAWLRRFLKTRGIEIPEIGAMNILHQVNVGRIPFLGGESFNAMKQTRLPDDIVNSNRNSNEDITIVFTSGTTGQPKGVVHTIASMQATFQRISDYAEFKHNDVIYDSGILFIIPALMIGAAVILRKGSFNAEATVNAYCDYAVTKTLEVPSQMQEITQYLRKTGRKLPDTLRELMLGAAPVFAEFLAELQTYVAPTTRIWSVYGMTELLPAAFVSIEDKLRFERGHGDLVGKPIEGIQAELAEDGELVLAGTGLFDRYLGHDRITKHPTGDLARIDDQGRIVLLGRKKDMIIRGKYNIYPPLFEPSIRQIKGVTDAALVGIYNPDKADEEIILFVQAASDQKDLDALSAFIKQQLLTGPCSIDVYAQPDYIFFTEIPYSGRSLKLDKKALRGLGRQLLNIPSQSLVNIGLIDI
jgi:acyl-CoA synthetase (AMP-forming)/AMP-acid ligase II